MQVSARISALLTLVACGLLTACVDSPTSSMPDHRIAVLTDPNAKGKLVAVPKSCPEWEQEMGDGLENDYPANFGCAQNYNLAKMIVEPNDLVRGRVPSMADANPGVLSIERYRADKKKELINPKDLGATSK